MIAFQYVAVAALVATLVSELAIAAWSRRFSTTSLARILTWAAAAAAILFPGILQTAADGLGIHRGTDLMLYIFILLSLGTSFYLYARYRSVQCQVTELIRRYAIEHARQGRPPATGLAEASASSE